MSTSSSRGGSTSPARKRPTREGRPSKLTPESQSAILNAVSAGNTLETAAAYAGIARSTLNAWMRRGAHSKGGEYADFSEAPKKAQADAEVRNVAMISAAASQTWQAAAWWLERRHPESWAKREMVQHSTGPNAFRVVTGKATDQEKVEAAKDALRRVREKLLAEEEGEEQAEQELEATQPAEATQPQPQNAAEEPQEI